ncbi:MAG: hypothetical protein IPI10_10605 [Bacteroidetes bacterium]|nr:hypothetical protein [Bacteroidota bacterium]
MLLHTRQQELEELYRTRAAGGTECATQPQTSNPNEVLLNTTAGSLNVVYLYSIIANGDWNTQRNRASIQKA